MNIDYKAIGERIRTRRKELKLTQQKLAEKADLSDTNISHIERGATKLSLPSLIAITNALNTTTDHILMDVIENSDTEFKNEYSSLLSKCSKEEADLLYNINSAVLNVLRKNNKKF